MVRNGKARQVAFGVAALALVSAAPAFAGFQWKGASAPAAAAPQAPAAGPLVVAQKVAPVEKEPIALSGGKTPPAAPAAAQKNSAPAPASSADFVSGFGDDLPLTIALAQIVPPTYKTALGPGVSGDTLVSWRGDRPWRDVLKDAVSGAGLELAINGNTVAVKDAALDGAMTAPAAASAPTQLAPPPLEKKPEAAAAAKPQHSDPAITWGEDKPPVAAAPVQTVEVAPVMSAPQIAFVPVRQPQAPAPAAFRSTPWQANKGETLHDVLAAWSKAADTELYWSTDYDYRLAEPVAFGGDFGAAAEQLLSRFAASHPQPYGELHRNPAGKNVLVIKIYYTAG